MPHRTEIREGEQRHARLDPQTADELGGRRRDLCQGFSVGIDVDGAIGEKERLLRLHEHVDAADMPAPRLRPDHFERRPDGVRIIHLDSCHHGIGLTGPEHEQGVIHGIEHALARFAQRDALAAPPLP